MSLYGRLADWILDWWWWTLAMLLFKCTIPNDIFSFLNPSQLNSHFPTCSSPQCYHNHQAFPVRMAKWIPDHKKTGRSVGQCLEIPECLDMRVNYIGLWRYHLPKCKSANIFVHIVHHSILRRSLVFWEAFQSLISFCAHKLSKGTAILKNKKSE